MPVPRLLNRSRRGPALALGLAALAQAGLAAAFAAQIGSLVDVGATPFSLAVPGAIAAAAAAMLLLERRIGEHFAQSFVIECRAALFNAVIRSRGAGGEARWLTGLVGDMAALRNYALRGSVRLFTTSISGGAAVAWLALSYPQLRLAILPMLLAMIVLAPIALRLKTTIADQRRERGRLTRFVIRRVRIEAAGAASQMGHGRRKLQELSTLLAGEAIRRATVVGTMEGIALAAGMISTITLVMLVAQAEPAARDTGSLLAGFAIVGFASARLLEGVRALHARIGGSVSLRKLERMLRQSSRTGDRPAKERRNPDA